MKSSLTDLNSNPAMKNSLSANVTMLGKKWPTRLRKNSKLACLPSHPIDHCLKSVTRLLTLFRTPCSDKCYLRKRAILTVTKACICSSFLRADMDGLPMPENNPNLEYRTKTDFAHMCGHDGHMATLLAAA